MGEMLNKIRIEDLEPGDHIYTWRVQGSYSHHGIYEGDRNVIHLTRGPGGGGGGGSSSPGISGSSDGRVRSCSIEDFLSGGELYRFEYGANPLRFLVQRAGTCTCVSSDPPGAVVKRAQRFLNRDGVYNLLDNNCEDFAFYCKTSLADVSASKKTGSSGQIAAVVAAIISILGCFFVPDGLFPASFVGRARMFCFLYSSIRLHFYAGLETVRVRAYISLHFSAGLERVQVPVPVSNWMQTFATAMLVLWFNPESIILRTCRSIFLTRLASRLSKIHSSKLLVYIINYAIALAIFWGTPKDKVLQDAKTFYLDGFSIVHVTNPLKLRQYVNDTLWLHVCSLTAPESIHRPFRLVRLSSYFFGLFADRGSRGLVLPFEHILNCTRMLIFWYWTPQDTDLQWMRLFLLSVCLSKFVANLRNHHLSPSEYVIAVILASTLHNGNPQYVFAVIACLAYGNFTLFLISPNFHLNLRKPIDYATSIFFSSQAYDCILIVLWHSIPERTIFSWIRLFLLIALSPLLINNR